MLSRAETPTDKVVADRKPNKRLGIRPPPKQSMFFETITDIFHLGYWIFWKKREEKTTDWL